MPSIRPLPAVTDVAWPDLIAAARGHQSSCGGSGSLSARNDERFGRANSPYIDENLDGSLDLPGEKRRVLERIEAL